MVRQAHHDNCHLGIESNRPEPVDGWIPAYRLVDSPRRKDRRNDRQTEFINRLYLNSIMKKKIYTLGTGLRSLEDFIEIINSYNIDAIIDVRSYPSSKFEYFKKINLEPLLKKEMLEYHYLGKELGGFRKEGYDHYIITKEFEEGVKLLERIASTKASVIICAERFPWKCHRKYIAQALQKKGWIIEHILDKGKVWLPKTNRTN
jgi:hypothetical protein